MEHTITLGNMLTIITTVVSVGLAGFKISARLAKMEMKLNLMWEAFKRDHKLGDTD